MKEFPITTMSIVRPDGFSSTCQEHWIELNDSMRFAAANDGTGQLYVTDPMDVRGRELLGFRPLHRTHGKPLKASLFRAISDGVFRSLRRSLYEGQLP